MSVCKFEIAIPDIFGQQFVMDNLDDSWNMDVPVSKAISKNQKQQQPEKEEPEDDDKEQQISKEKGISLDESNWMNADNQIVDQLPKPKSNNNKDSQMPNTSFCQDVNLSIGPARELDRNDQNTSWFHSDFDKKKKEEQSKPEGTLANNQEQANDAPRRGNRGNREEREVPKRGNRDREEEDKQQPRRGNRGNRDMNNQDGDYRKKSQYYEPRQNQYERGGYRGRGRGNYRDYNNNGDGFRKFKPKFQQQQNGQGRSNNFGDNQYRNNKYQQRNNNYNPNYRNNYQNHNNNNYNNNNYNNNYQNRSYNPKFTQYKQNQPERPNNTVKEAEVQKVIQKKVNQITTAQIPPKGRRCWPQTSINILGCKVVLTCRHLSDFRCKLLVMPYSTVQMEYYPGNAINSSSIDYRKKIISKGSQIARTGAIYLQKALQVYSFEAIAFLKIDESQVEQSLKIGIKEVIRYVQKIEKPMVLQSIVFPICEELGNPNWVIGPFLQFMELCRKAKEVWITTIQGSNYVKASAAFNSQVEKYFKANQIFIN